MTNNFNKKFEYIKNEGVKLALHSWIPDDAKAVLFFFHGLQSHAGWSFEVGSYLANDSIAVFILDRRGVGLSEGLRGDIPSMQILFDDYQYVLQKVRQVYPDLPLVLLGQSLGGSILAGLLSQSNFNIKYDAIVFCAAGLGRKHDQLTQEEYENMLQNKSDDLWGFDLPVCDMTDQTRFIKFIQDDPYVYKYLTYRAKAVLLEVENAYWNQRGVIQDKPSIYVYPQFDPIVNINAALKVFRRLSSNCGMTVELPSSKHYLWFTDQRDVLLKWLSHYVLTKGYKS